MNRFTDLDEVFAPGIEPWQQQPGETAEEFAAFKVYRDLERGKRSLKEVKEQLELLKMQMSGDASDGFAIVSEDDLNDESSTTVAESKNLSARLKQWYRKYHWPERVATWDNQIDERIRAQRLNDIEKMSRQHAQQAQAACVLGAFATQEALTAVRAAVGPDGKPRSAEQKLVLLERAAGVNRYLPKWQAAERLARDVRVKVADQEGLMQGTNVVWELRLDTPPPDYVPPDAESIFKARHKHSTPLEDPTDPEQPDDPNLDRADPIPRFETAARLARKP